MSDAIALAIAQLDTYLERYGLVVEGGQVFEQSKSMRTDRGGGKSITTASKSELHLSVVLKHLDKIRVLEKSRAELVALERAPGTHSDVDAWLSHLTDEPGTDGA